MTNGQLKALLFARDVAPLDYTEMSHYAYPYRAKMPCSGGALKILIRSLRLKEWIHTDGRITDTGRTALAARVQADLDQSLEDLRR